MTRRERLEAKQAKREEWAAKAEQRAAGRFSTATNLVAGIPFGQPILVGHHSEKRHRRTLERCDQNMRKGSEESRLAAHHASKADGLAHQLNRSIFSDDPDALDALADRVVALEAKRDAMKQANAWWRKHSTMIGFPGISEETAARLDTEIPTRYSWERQPFPSYSLTNLGARIRQAKERAKHITAQTERSMAAEANGGCLIEGTGDYVRVTFAEKPDRTTLDALRAAGFRWGGGSWTGQRVNLPPNLLPV